VCPAAAMQMCSNKKRSFGEVSSYGQTGKTLNCVIDCMNLVPKA